MSDWQFAQENPAEQLAQLHFFSVMKRRGRGRHCVSHHRERVWPRRLSGQRLRFFAEADKPVNQKTASFVPWRLGGIPFSTP